MVAWGVPGSHNSGRLHRTGRATLPPQPASSGDTVENSVRVEIYDQVYHLRGESQEDQAQELARYVDERMRTVADVTGAVDSLRIAVLAALHLADEVFRLRARQQELEGQIRERAERCLDLVDRTLERSA